MEVEKGKLTAATEPIIINGATIYPCIIFACIINHEDSKLTRVWRELLERKDINGNENWKQGFVTKTYVREMVKTKAESFTNKPLHGVSKNGVTANIFRLILKLIHAQSLNRESIQRPNVSNRTEK